MQRASTINRPSHSASSTKELPDKSSTSTIAKRKMKRKPSIGKSDRTPIYTLPELRGLSLNASHSKRLSRTSSKHSAGNAGSGGVESKATKNLVNILDTLKKEYDKIERSKQSRALKEKKAAEAKVSKASMSKTPSQINAKLTDGTWAERSQNVREKLDEIMKKHSQTLKSLSNLYKTPMETTTTAAYSQMNELTSKWPSMTTSAHVPMSPPTKSYQIATVTTVAPNMGKPIVKKSSVSRYNTAAIHNVAALNKTNSKVSQNANNVKTYVHNPYQLRDEIKLLREKVDQAIKYKRTFTICGNYYSVRHALLVRGWIEKIHPNHVPANVDVNLLRRLQTLTIPELSIGLKDKELGHIYRNIIMSKMIGSLPVAFFWDLNRETYRNNADSYKDSLVNFINKNRFNYANKQGLCESAKTAYWHNNPGVSFLRTPRSYCLMNTGDPDEFIQDFKISAAMSFLKWIVFTHESNVSKLISSSGKVPLSYFHFALRQCANYARKLKHEDIDKELPMPPDKEWQTFLDYFYKAVHVGSHFKQSGLESEMSLVHKSRTMLKKLKELTPYLDMDGYMNIWILKPSYGSRGVGIHFCRTLQFVLKVVKENKNSSYVIQKYIERPLLIYNTKFDIRQWFLISSTQPITIWIYKECYLRFSSQTYNLRKLHESIHLTNNSVQSKYHNGNRDLCLPFHNMWFMTEFKDYLNNIGYPNVYDQIIFPGMKECIVAAILTNQEQMFRTNKAFELHGADFMITEDFKPWLIEINSKPALNPSTAVTTKLCPMVLEDVIKVVIDNVRNPRASTGNFELIYKEKIIALPHPDSHMLRLEGRPVALDYFLDPDDAAKSVDSKHCASDDSLNVITTADYMKYVGNEMKKTLRQLLSIIEKERTRRKAIRNKAPLIVEESFNYCQDMQKIQTNMEEIEEIFKRDIMDKTDSSDSIAVVDKGTFESKVDLKQASAMSLRSSSKIVATALTSLSKPHANSRTVNDVIRMVSSIKFAPESKATINKNMLINEVNEHLKLAVNNEANKAVDKAATAKRGKVVIN